MSIFTIFQGDVHVPRHGNTAHVSEFHLELSITHRGKPLILMGLLLLVGSQFPNTPHTCTVVLLRVDLVVHVPVQQ